MSLNPLLVPEFFRPYIEENLTPSEPFQYWLTLITAYINSYGGDKTFEGFVELDDDEEILLEDGKAGYGFCMIGDTQEYAHFVFTSAGVVTLLTDISGNVVNTDTDTNLCIYDNGTAVAIKNRLGSTLNLRYSVKYNG